MAAFKMSVEEQNPVKQDNSQRAGFLEEVILRLAQVAWERLFT
jgi:hypothetical protein